MFPVGSLFRLRVSHHLDHAAFPAPASSNAACGFPRTALSCLLRTAHEAVDRVARAIVQHKTRVIDIDLSSYFDNVRHDRLLAKVAERVDDGDVMRLLKVMLKANGKQGVPQGGGISPLLSNLYLTEVDRMLERAKEATRYGKYTGVEYARFADDLVILIDAHPRHDWLMAAVEKRLREELAELQVFDSARLRGRASRSDCE